MVDVPTEVIAPLPSVLRSRNPLSWMAVFGPGAIIASLTIGTGELIFYARWGAVWLFNFISVCHDFGTQMGLGVFQRSTHRLDGGSSF